jgi:UDP-N-acetylmuramoyl-L-alanyl-D-glutamate--2,6-diaminopimelate ligase
MLLNKLLENIIKIKPEDDREITGLVLDSRLVKPGDLFLAYPGGTSDGRNYINVALENGASAIICEAEGFKLQQAIPVPLIKISKLQKKVTYIAAEFYQHPTSKMQVIGVTGTNGKTSTTQFIASALSTQNLPCGVIGTMGAGFPNKLQYGSHTTPDPITLQKLMFDFHNQGAKAVAMEVSSHGLEQGRVAGVDFAIAVFTNLTRDHLDYHGSMANYGKAKQRLFQHPNLRYAVINADDDFGYKLITDFADHLPIIAYSANGIKTKVPSVMANNLQLHANGFSVEITSPWGEGTLNSSLFGRFNVSNLLAVLAVLGIMGISFSKILASLAELTTVPGRMQVLGGGDKPLVIVDFAHTPDALEKVLLALREHSHGKIWCVFGCGGDRDRGKRPLMGKIAERFSDHVIITDDNPRTEDSQQIVDDILQGLLCPWAVEVEHDRHVAISHAIECTAVGDVVLIAGKGHEPYQIIGKEKIPFSDVEEVTKVLK